MAAGLRWFIGSREHGARCDRRRRARVFVSADSVSTVAADLRWFMRPRRVVDGRGLGVRCDRRPRVQDFVSAGGATPTAVGLRQLKRPHSVVAATRVSSLAVGVKVSVVMLLGLP